MVFRSLNNVLCCCHDMRRLMVAGHSTLQDMPKHWRAAFRTPSVIQRCFKAQLCSVLCCTGCMEHAIHHRCMLCRHTVRQVYLTKQQRYHAALLDADSSFPYMNHRTSDDSVRFLSVFFALSKALDKAVLLARMAYDDPWIKQQAGQRTWNQYRLWFGR